jgi:hypothetical protein
LLPLAAARGRGYRPLPAYRRAIRDSIPCRSFSRATPLPLASRLFGCVRIGQVPVGSSADFVAEDYAKKVLQVVYHPWRNLICTASAKNIYLHAQTNAM